MTKMSNMYKLKYVMLSRASKNIMSPFILSMLLQIRKEISKLFLVIKPKKLLCGKFPKNSLMKNLKTNKCRNNGKPRS